jgi:hypothetical protein
MDVFRTRVLMDRGEYEALIAYVNAAIRMRQDRENTRNELRRLSRLLVKALHQLAVASGAKDPAHFINRWLSVERSAANGGVPIKRIRRQPTRN